MDLFTSALIAHLREENQRLRAEGGRTYCVVCDQHCKVYTYDINARQAYLLILLYKYTRNRGELGKTRRPYHHKSAFLGDISDGAFAKLEYWNLIERADKRGYWRVTQPGVEFVLRKRKVPKFVKVYNAKLLDTLTDEYISILDALETKFDYVKLMTR